MGSAFFVKNFLEPVAFNINNFRTAAKCVIFIPTMRVAHSGKAIGIIDGL